MAACAPAPAAVLTAPGMLKCRPHVHSVEGRPNMAGHSKWANIKHKKAATDAKRGKIWTRLIKEITVAARMGGDDGAAYEEVRYDGYGIGGAAIIVDCMTDNRVRTVAEVRHAFNKHGGNMGAENSVSFMFKHCGQFLFAPGVNEDALMEAALEAGAEDVIADEEGGFEVLCPPLDFAAVKDALDAAGFKAEVAEIIMKPATETVFTGDDAIKMQKLMDALENLDDVQEIYSNALIED